MSRDVYKLLSRMYVCVGRVELANLLRNNTDEVQLNANRVIGLGTYAAGYVTNQIPRCSGYPTATS